MFNYTSYLIFFKVGDDVWAEKTFGPVLILIDNTLGKRRQNQVEEINLGRPNSADVTRDQPQARDPNDWSCGCVGYCCVVRLIPDVGFRFRDRRYTK